VSRIYQAVTTGVHFGTPTRVESELALFLVNCFDSIEMIRFVNSGSEATIAALRAVRAFTGRSGVVKFLGGYHGWDEAMLSGSPYAAPHVEGHTYLAKYNDLEGTRNILAENYENIAAIIVEPVAGNMGVISPRPDFLPGLRALCDEFGALLVFDEVMTGFRVAYAGAQSRYGIRPDITCLGKIIGGGLPIGAYGGNSSIMSVMAPLGSTYQGGTYSGNPLSATAGLATLHFLDQDQGYWKRLEEKAKTLCSELTSIANRFGIPTYAEVIGGMFTFYFLENQPIDYASVQEANVKYFAKFFQGMLEAGVYWPPSQFEAAHMSLAHNDSDLELTIKAAYSVFANW